MEDRLVHPLTRITFKGDSRTYKREKPTEHSQYHAYCEETEAHEDGIWKCSISQGEDDIKRTLAHSQTHECKFKAPSSPFQKQGSLGALLAAHRNIDEPVMATIIKEVAIVIAQANMCANSACDGSLCVLLLTVLKAGWNKGFSQAKLHATEEFLEYQPGDIREKPAAAHISRLAPISKSLHRVHQVPRSELLAIFGDCPSVGFSIGGITIKCRKVLKIDVVNPVSDTCPFTSDFFQNNPFDTVEFTHHFDNGLNELTNHGLSVTGVTSDGCPFQQHV
jgi:hypothetical protein